MAVITVSKIQVRSGFQEDLPSLDTGEFGWCVDTQRLFIGKGTLAEGAPTVGVTEILTEYSSGLINISITALEANVANLQSNVAFISSIVGNLIPVTTQLLDNQSSIVNISGVSIDSLSSRVINYNITRSTAMRIGTIKVSNYAGNAITFSDDYTETASTGVTLYFTGNLNFGNAVLGYTTTNTGINGNITYNYQDLRTIT